MSLAKHFMHPEGVGGRFAGWIMATRGSNVTRNRWVVDQLDLQPGERVLEIGCGPGVAAERAVATGATVVAVDPSDVMRSMTAKRNAAAVAEGRLQVVDGSAADLPPGPFDAAYAVNTIMFWEGVDEALAGLAERMAPGGRVAVAVQPRFRGATDADARRIAEENAERLGKVGFTDLRVESLDLRPVDCAGAFGRLAP